MRSMRRCEPWSLNVTTTPCQFRDRGISVKKWTREEAAQWISEHQFISTDGDHEEVVIDGDGRDIYEAKPDRNIDISVQELGQLLAFVFNDYVELVKS